MISVGIPVQHRVGLPQFSVDETFARVVRQAGGSLVSDLLPTRENLPKNADYVFPEYNVIAELKRLERDASEDHEFSERLNRLYREWVSQGKPVPPVWGRARIDLRALPLECANQIISLYRKPIHRRIRDANQQIWSTKQALNMNEAKGLLVLIQDGDYSINPETVMNLVSRCMRGGHFSSINDLVFANGNMRAVRSGDTLDYMFFTHAHRDANRAIPHELIERINSGWRQELDRLAGGPMNTVKPENFTQFIDSLRYARRRTTG
jgi:hypothetical protein